MKNTIESNNNELRVSMQDNNSCLTAANVKAHFQAHGFNLENGKHGIENKILDILKSNGAVYSIGDENGDFRKIVVSQSMFAETIINEVQSWFAAGGKRYQYQVIYNYLCTILKKSGKVHGFRLTKVEDSARKCPKPRQKFFMVLGAE
jgi:hypothetical protein